jgi:DNA-binding NarL/FixJ family response regulator
VTLRLLLADDQELVRTGFRMILDSRDGLDVVGEASNGEQAVTLARRLRPDVALMDVRMPVLDGVEATRRIVAADCGTRVLMLTTYGLDDVVGSALRAGASGFLLKDARPAELVEAIHVIARGDALLAPAVTRSLLARYSDPTGSQPGRRALRELTDRETEVLTLVASALSNAEIAQRLVLSEATVKTHVSSILRKLGLRDRVQAVVLAFDTGLVHPRAE